MNDPNEYQLESCSGISARSWYDSCFGSWMNRVLGFPAGARPSLNDVETLVVGWLVVLDGVAGGGSD